MFTGTPKIDFASFPFDWCHHSTDYVDLYHSPLVGTESTRMFAFYPNKDDSYRRVLTWTHPPFMKRMPDNFWFSGDWESDTLTESGRACLRLKGYIIYATLVCALMLAKCGSLSATAKIASRCSRRRANGKRSITKTCTQLRHLPILVMP